MLPTDESLIDYGYILLHKASNSFEIHEAVDKFKKALEINPKNQQAWEGITACSTKLADLEWDNEAQQLDPYNYKAYLYPKTLSKQHPKYNRIGIYQIEANWVCDYEVLKGYNVKKDDYIERGLIKALDLAPESEKNRIRELIKTNINDAYPKAVKLCEEMNKDNKSGKGACYIATTVYGSYDAPETIILRNFRDKKLLTNPYGQTFVRIYYFLSPPFAHYLENSKGLNGLVKKVLDCFIKKIS